MTILNDKEIIELNIPAEQSVFRRGLEDAMHCGGHSGAFATNIKTILPVYHPARFDTVIGWPIVPGCRTNDFSDADLEGINRTNADEVFLRIYPLYLQRFQPMISPFNSQMTREITTTKIGTNFALDTVSKDFTRKIISKGLTSFGYDVSLDRNFKLFTNINSAIVDPKRLDERCLVDADIRQDNDGAEYVILPPNSYILGNTVEYFKMPRDVLAICMGKSTYARAGAIVNVTPIEPGFEGSVVIEISNATNLPLKIYVNEGISQFIFLRGSGPCRVSYADRGGKYQGQTGVTLPTV